MSGRRGRSITRKSGTKRADATLESPKKSSKIGTGMDKGRSRSPRRSSNLDEAVPANWTITKLKAELNNKGIVLPNTTPHKTLLKLYEQLCAQDRCALNITDKNSETGNALDYTENDDVIHNDTEQNNNNGGAHDISSIPSELPIYERISQEMRTMQATIAEMARKINNPSLNSADWYQEHANERFSEMTKRRPVDELPPVNIVPQKVRNDILAHRYVNLSLLLIPGMESNNETQILNQNGEQVVIRAGDARLHRKLNISEFRAAFAKFRNVICEVEPYRRKELDTYAEMIDGMYIQYGGTHFYDYHIAFSRKAEQYELQGMPVDWSACDTKLYLTTFSGLRTVACEMCMNTNHLTAFCPLTAHSSGNRTQTANFREKHRPSNNMNNQTISSYNRARTDKFGRPRKFHLGREICNNFNVGGCSSTHPNNSIVHICAICKSASHAAYNCDIGKNVPKQPLKEEAYLGIRGN